MTPLDHSVTRSNGARQRFEGPLRTHDWALILSLSAVALAVVSRSLVAVGAPGWLNFLHFPVALLAFASTPHPNDVGLTRMRKYILVFCGGVLVSALVNDLEILRFLLTLLVWTEPLLVAYVIWASLARRTVSSRTVAIFLSLLIGLQYLAMTIQIPRRSIGPDELQGTFLGSGTGAHVAPSLVLMGALILLAYGFLENRLSTRARSLAFGVALFGFALSVLGAARFVTIAASVAFLAAAMILSVVGRERTAGSIGLVLVATSLLVLLAVVLPKLDTIPGVDILQEGVDIKSTGIRQLGKEIAVDPTVVIIGHGPGTTLSRVALETPGGTLNPDSAIAALGVETTEWTLQVREAMGRSAIGRSSLFVPWSSVLGVLGDVGVVGLTLYAGMWVPLISTAIRDSSPARVLAVVGVTLLALILGSLQIFLEDPGFALVFATFLALAAGPDDVRTTQ
jgi:hypothetical protein